MGGNFRRLWGGVGWGGDSLGSGMRGFFGVIIMFGFSMGAGIIRIYIWYI